MPPPTVAAPFLTVAFFVVVAALLGVELLLGACDVLFEEDELGVEELEDDELEDEELDGGLFANPVEFVDGCVVVTGFFAFFAFFLAVSAETNNCCPCFEDGNEITFDLPTVVVFSVWRN